MLIGYNEVFVYIIVLFGSLLLLRVLYFLVWQKSKHFISVIICRAEEGATDVLLASAFTCIHSN